MFHQRPRRAFWRTVLVAVLAANLASAGFADAESPVSGGLPKLIEDVTALIARVTGLEAAIDAEVARASAAEATLASAIAAEEARAAAEAAALRAALEAERERASAEEAELAAAIEAERARAAAAEEALNGQLDEEAAARERGDADTLSAAEQYTDSRVAAAMPSDIGFLVDLPCNVGTALEGRTRVSYSSAPPYAMTLICEPIARLVLTVTRAGTGIGSVTGIGINCGIDCTESFALGQTVTLTATPAAGSAFAGFSGCNATVGMTCTVTLTSARTVVAAFTFIAPRPTLSVIKTGTGTGTVTGTGISCGADCTEQYNLGQTVTLTATPVVGSAFAAWSGCNSVSGLQCTVSMTASRTVAASFVLIPRPTLTVMRFGTGSGTVTGTGISCGADCTEQYNFGTTVVLSATPTTGSAFGGWSGCNSVAGTQCSVTLTASRTVTATFITSMQMLTGTVTSAISFFGAGSGGLRYNTTGVVCMSIPGSTRSCPFGPVASGATITFSALPSLGNTYTWGGICSGNIGLTCTRTMPSTPATVSITFRR